MGDFEGDPGSPVLHSGVDGGGMVEIKLALNLQSAAFREGEKIPVRYTCNGENVSPPLRWSKADASVKSWCIFLEDPGAPSGTFTHWVIFNIPPDVNYLPEGLPRSGQLPNRALQGKNDTGRTGYSGPCPPPGPAHHYYFNLYALDRMLSLPAGASKKDVWNSMRNHIIAQGRLGGIYQSR
jgi:Raf kinase inhibitor-like YbhB/YbcL family protein